MLLTGLQILFQVVYPTNSGMQLRQIKIITTEICDNSSFLEKSKNEFRIDEQLKVAVYLTKTNARW